MVARGREREGERGREREREGGRERERERMIVPAGFMPCIAVGLQMGFSLHFNFRFCFCRHLVLGQVAFYHSCFCLVMPCLNPSNI